MDILARAVEVVQRNLSSLLLYLVATVGASTLVTALRSMLIGDDLNPAETLSGMMLLYDLGLMALLILPFSVAQAIVFARMGREIDRPLWKCESAWEALRRYFVLWLGLNILVHLFNRLLILTMPDDRPVLGFVFYLYVFLAIVYVPVGAAVMFQRRFEWRQFNEALTPLYRQFPKTLLVLLLNGAVSLFTMSLIVNSESSKLLYLDVICGYFDCVIFAAVWLICILDRQTPEEIDLEF